ncbi:MAG: hypothetical protein HY721_21770 [Planctomycetes bacterium]|nr:hypothetical protein [Planctomycetota bacterium]
MSKEPNGETKSRMKGVLLLADAVRAHPDGTFSLLRGGIDRVHAPRTQPIHFRGSLVARVVGTLAEAGEHDFQLRILNEEGQSIAPDIIGGFRIPEAGGGAVAVTEFALILPAYGRYTFSLLVDRHELDAWEVRAVEAQTSTQSGSRL